jgi:hypothetical protein
MSFITIFTAPKPFTNPHINMIQRNAILSWKNLGPKVEVILVGDEAGIAEAASDLGVHHISEVERNSRGTPLISSTFKVARDATTSPIMAFINADILLLPDFITGSEIVSRKMDRFLIIGRRWNLDIRQPIDFSANWDQWLLEQIQQRGRKHAPSGSDYFVYPRSCFTDMPDFAVGRPCWDNWTIFHAREKGIPVINASQSITIVHQDHDYSHLPGGRPPYGGPEAGENLRNAGGVCDIFFQHDATNYLVEGKIKKPQVTWKRFWREVEIFPLITLHSPILGQWFNKIFHPIKAYAAFRAWLRNRSRKTA